jgi:hypothetical protein
VDPVGPLTTPLLARPEAILDVLREDRGMTVHMWVATAAWATLTLGVAFWARPRVHLRLVALGMLVDVALVLHLQFTREAVQQAVRFDRPVLEQAHIAVSTLAVVLYVPTMIFLVHLLKDPDIRGYRRRYVRTFWAAYALRTAGFVLMFSMGGS